MAMTRKAGTVEGSGDGIADLTIISSERVSWMEEEEEDGMCLERESERNDGINDDAHTC